MDKDIANCRGDSDCHVLILDPLGEIPPSLRLFLDFGGYRSLCAESLEGLDAISELRPPEIVFSGARFGWSGGIDSIKDRWPGTFNILVSAEQHGVAELERVYLGADGYLDIPITFAKLDKVLGRYWEKRRRIELETGSRSSPATVPSKPLIHALDFFKRAK